MPTSSEPVEDSGVARHDGSGQPDGAEDSETESAEAERARSQLRERVHRGRVVTVVAAGLAAAVVGVVALLGGFGAEAVRVTDVAPGQTLVSGPFEITLTRATVQRRGASDYGPERWTVTTTGTIANTTPSSLVPNTYDDSFVFAALRLDADGAAPETSTLTEATPGSSAPERRTVAPGVGPVPWVLTFVFQSPPGEEVLVGVYQQRFGPRYILDDEQVWQNTSALDKISLPLERLPDADY